MTFEVDIFCVFISGSNLSDIGQMNHNVLWFGGFFFKISSILLIA